MPSRQSLGWRKGHECAGNDLAISGKTISFIKPCFGAIGSLREIQIYTVIAPKRDRSENVSPRVAPQLLAEFPELKRVFKARDSMHPGNGRYFFHKYLIEVYRVGRRWSQEKIRKRRTRDLTRLAKIPAPRGLHAFRAVIETTLPSLGAKSASRWTRSLEFALSEDVPPDGLKHFFRTNGGMANCARKAAGEIPKRRYRRPTWD